MLTVLRAASVAGSLVLVAGGCGGGHRRTPLEMVSLSILPGDQSIAVGDTLRAALVARYSDGSVRDLARNAVWRSSASRYVRLVGPGRLRGIARGRVTISASAGGRRATTSVTVGARSLGPLRVSKANPRYFEDRTGRVVYLAGAHTWGNLVDNGTTDPPPKFDYTRFLHGLQVHDLRVFRLWSWEQASKSGELKGPYFFSPLVYRRTGPGKALDGKPRFDLTKFDPAYFSRLRARVIAARERGIYVSVMLFDGWSIEKKGDGDNPWDGHPFNRANNVNGIDGDRNGDGSGAETHTLVDPRITRLQEAYVARVVRAVGDQPNVLYEVSNESDAGSLAWQNHMVRFIRAREGARRHPVGITAEYPGGTNAELFASQADWVSPNGDITDLPPGPGVKVVLADTDHYCGVCGDPSFPWNAFTRGLNPLLMDPFDGKAIGLGALDAPHDDPRWEVLRRRLGVTESLSAQLDMRRLVPNGELSSTGYCLSDGARGTLYVVYVPRGGAATVDVTASRSRLRVEWVDPDTGAVTRGGTVEGGAKRSFTTRADRDAVLVLRAFR